MKRTITGIFLMLLLCSHDMYLKLDEYRLKPWSDSIIQLFNGTFDRSDNVITRDRMLDVSIVGNGIRTAIDSSQWYEKDSTTFLKFSTEGPGTWVAGVSTKARSFAQSAEAFNNYLQHDGVLDMLEYRTEQGNLQDSAVEKYSKHVKTIFQVGKQLTDDYKTELGYPIEFIPLENPYNVHAGHDLTFKLLFQQKPLANQLVYAGYKTSAHEHSHEHTHDGETHDHDHGADHHHDEMIQLRTDDQGLVKVPISQAGIWYLRTIHLVEVDTEDLTHESNWATITFAVAGGDHAHDHDHSHEEEHQHGEGLPGYLYWIISVLLIAGLFFWFNRKQ